MGRMVQEERVGLGAAQRQALIKSAAVQLSGLTVSEFNDRLEQLVLLLPDLRDRLPSLRPELLAELCADVQVRVRQHVRRECGVNSGPRGTLTAGSFSPQMLSRSCRRDTHDRCLGPVAPRSSPFVEKAASIFAAMFACKLPTYPMPPPTPYVRQTTPQLANQPTAAQETARRIIQLRQWLPAANVSQILAERPALLRADDFAALPSALAKLRHMFPEGGVDALVTQQPYLLAEDVDEIVGELERYEALSNDRVAVGQSVPPARSKGPCALQTCS